MDTAGHALPTATRSIPTPARTRGTQITQYSGKLPFVSKAKQAKHSQVQSGTASPSCFTISDFDNYGNTFLHQGCSTTEAYLTAYMYTTVDVSSTPSSVSSYVLPDNRGGSSSSSTTPHPGPPPRKSNSTTDGPSHTKNNTKSQNSSSSSAGAIAGGVVGGIAVLALVGGVIGYLVYRKKKDRVQPVPEVSQYSTSY